MNKTVLITGTSSGIGKAAVIAFAQAGWNVAATLRTPEKEQDFNRFPNVKRYRLDVTDRESIELALQQAIADFGQIDVLVNNAGYGADGIFEHMDDSYIRQQFDTNVFGLMRVTQAMIPHFRANGGGTIIQVSSMGGQLTFPLFSIYHGTKWAVEGFSEALQFEMDLFNIRIKIVEPGAIKTEFYHHSLPLGHDKPGYEEFVRKTNQVNQNAGKTAPGPEIVAKTILKAASDGSRKMRYPVGSNAPALLLLRKFLPLGVFLRIVRSVYKL